MKMSIKLHLIVSALSLYFTIGAVSPLMKLDFIDNKFEDFLDRIGVEQKEREKFTYYYSNVCTKMKESDEIKKRLAEGYLYKMALEGMQKRHPQWYQALQPFISDPRITLDTEINNVRMFIGGFLIRYGAYEEFTIVNKPRKGEESFFAGVWNSVKKFTVSTKNSIINWCTA